MRNNIDGLINLLDELTDDITRQVCEAKEKALIEKLPTMLKENGVNLCITEYRREGNSVDGLRFGFGIDRLDFTEHDKPFKDKIKSLQDECYKFHNQLMETEKDYQVEIERLNQRIAELESKETSQLPFDPLECANYLINATYERETSSLERAFAKTPDKVNSDRYTVDDLEQIAEHLLVYCKYNKESE